MCSKVRVNREEQETEVRSREQLREKVMPVRGTDGDVDCKDCLG